MQNTLAESINRSKHRALYEAVVSVIGTHILLKGWLDRGNRERDFICIYI